MSESWVKTISEFAKIYKGKFILSILSAIISVIGGIIPFIATYQIIILFINHNATLEEVNYWVIVSLIGYTTKMLFHGVSTVISHISAYNILKEIRLKISEKLSSAPLGNVIDESIGKIKSVMVDRVETVELPLAHIIPEGISNLLLSIGIFIYMLTIDWRMAIAGIVSIPLALIAYGGVFKEYKRLYDGYMGTSNYVNGVIVEYIEGIEVIKAFNQSTSSYEKYTKAVNKFLNYTMDWFKATWKQMNLGSAILPSTLLAIMPVGMYLYSKGSLSPEDLVISIILSMGLINPLMTFTVFVNDLSSIKYAVNDAKKYLDMEQLIQVDNKATISNYDIDFENVSFAYHKDVEDYALKNINIHIPQGQYYALLGPSGGGKSTMARLINRFWDTTEGNIKIGGVDIRKMPLKQLSSLISYVTQDNFLFNCSLKENIRIGNPKASDEMVYKAAKEARCDEFIKKLEKGYDTDAGDAGRRLSGGEKQRIAIARAMLKDSPIVILDEATAFTDPENEKEIQESITTLTKGKTLIVIAHRLSTVKNSNKLIVLKDGKIHDSGTHNELLKNCELYKDMWQAHIGAKKWSISGNSKVVK